MESTPLLHVQHMNKQQSINYARSFRSEINLVADELQDDFEQKNIFSKIYEIVKWNLYRHAYVNQYCYYFNKKHFDTYYYIDQLIEKKT